ncbi:Tim44-like domain-containing protein [Rhizophagus diaphanus]|nr:Tim44-like domain-containing protein [Rhizophagus diaphanus] [Rhizophagus sp. MUCL 43196]
MLGPRFNKVFRINLLSCQNNLSNPRYLIRKPNTLFLFTKISLGRNYSSEAELRDLRESLERIDPRYVPDFDFGIIDPYFKPLQMPSIFSKKYYRILYENSKNTFKNFMFGLNIAYCERKYSEYKDKPAEYWSPKSFKSKALNLYVEMNENYASKNLKALQNLVEDRMYNKIKYDLKHREGKFIWKYHGLVEKPKYINVRCILGHTRSTGNYLVQLTIKLHTKQSVGLYNKAGKLIAGDPKKVKDVLEYVVFQRKMWDKSKGWTIYGYFNDINNNLLTQTNTQTKIQDV